MLLRFPIEGNKDWCCRSHILVPLAIGDDGLTLSWTRCGVFNRHLTDDEILDALAIPEELNDVTELVFGDPTRGIPQQKLSDTEFSRREKRREYQREYYARKKGK